MENFVISILPYLIAFNVLVVAAKKILKQFANDKPYSSYARKLSVFLEKIIEWGSANDDDQPIKD